MFQGDEGAMKRVLFVDGEPRILEGLRRMLRPQGHEREKAFAPGGEAVRAIVCLTIFLGKLGLL
jgi:CheY-like chemotaxis protein